MRWLVWLLGLWSAVAHAEELYLADVGITVDLPRGWSVPRWGDWYLDAVDGRRTVQFHVETTPYQVPLTPEAARAWAERLARALEEAGNTGAEVARAVVAGDHAEVEVRYRHREGGRAVAIEHTFPGRGQVVHLQATALRRNAGRARAALAAWERAITWDKKPEPLPEEGGEVASEAGFGATLPAGWRTPLASEMGPVRELAALTGQGRIDRDRCWVGIHPLPEGEADLLLACQLGRYIGILDEHSFAGVEAELRAMLFGDAEVPVEPGEPVPTGSDGRLSVLYRPAATGERALRLAVTPYDRGLVLTWALGRRADLPLLDEAIRDVLASTTFTGPDGGRHPVSFENLVGYLVRYRNTDPVVVGPVLVAVVLLGAIVVFVRRRSRSNPYADLADDP